MELKEARGIGFQPVLRYATSSALCPADGNGRTDWKSIPRVASNYSRWGFTELTQTAGQTGSLSHGSHRKTPLGDGVTEVSVAFELGFGVELVHGGLVGKIGISNLIA